MGKSFTEKIYVYDGKFQPIGDTFTFGSDIDLAKLKIPDDAHGLFPLLAKAGIISGDFVENNFKMPGFRNRLVHGYSEIDHEKSYDYLQSHLADLRDFSAQVSRYVLDQSKT